MLLSSAGHRDGPIPAETRRIAGLLAREKTGEILAHLHRRPHLSASEVARLEAIHIATAQRYLKELVDAGLVGSRLRGHSSRPTEEYWLLEPRITIEIDLEGPTDDGGMADAAKRLLVRDRGHNNVVYDTDPRTGDVQGLLILSDDHPRLVEDRIRLSATVGRFLARLPYAAGHAQSVWDTMQQAGLNEEHLPEILAAVGRFTTPDPRGLSTSSKDTVLEAPSDRTARSLTEPIGGDDDEASGPGAEGPGATDGLSARPVDPEILELFRTLAARDRIVETPPMAILEVRSVDKEPSPSSPDDRTEHDRTEPQRRVRGKGPSDRLAPEPAP